MATCCLALGGWGAAAGDAGVLAQKPRTTPVKSTTQCYATRDEPDAVVCYRHSWKAEFRHGDVVYVPLLIQVPRPSRPLPVTFVDSLDDIHPSATTGA